jgi:tetratricopeptide (TPR) repeat protein
MTSTPRREQVLAAYTDDHPGLTLELARAYLSRDPDDRTVLLIYGEVLTTLRRLPEARVALERALELSEFDQRHAALRLLGQLHDAAGRIAEAEDAYQAAIAARPTHASAYIYLGGMLARFGRLEEAEAIHRRATTCIDGAIDEAFLNLGLVQRARGDYLGALASLREAQSRDPDDPGTAAALRDVERLLFDFPAP